MKNRAGHKFAKLAAVLLFLGVSGCGILKDDSKEVIIKVNGRSITAGDYRDSLKRLVPTDKGHEADELVELKKELVTEMVEEELLLEEAEKAGITVSEDELASEVDLIKKEYGEASFKEALEERYGSIEGWEERIKKKLLVKKAIDEVTRGAMVTDREAQEYYRKHKDEFARPEQARARMIVVSSEEQATTVRGSLTPANFAEVARVVSLSPEGKEGGDLGYFGRGDMPGEFESVVFSLKPKEISGVVKTDYGYHIFMLEDKRKGGASSYTEAKGKIMEGLRGEKAASVLNDWIAVRKRASKIEIREELL